MTSAGEINFLNLVIFPNSAKKNSEQGVGGGKRVTMPSLNN